MSKRILIFGIGNINNLGDNLLIETMQWLVRGLLPDCEVRSASFVPNRADLRCGYRWSKRGSDLFYRLLVKPFAGAVRYRFEDLYYRLRYGHYFRDEIEGADAIVYAVGMLKYVTQDHSYLFNMINGIAAEKQIPVFMNAMSVAERDDHDWRSRQLLRAVNVPSVRMVTTRDGEQGLERLRRNWIRREEIETDWVGDPALWAPECYGIRKDPQAQKVGINVIRGNIFQSYCGGVTEAQLLAAYAELLRDLDRRGIDWVLFSNGAPCDQEFGERLLSEIGAPASCLLPRPENTRRFLEYISSFRAVFAGRLHACITSFALDVPVAGLLWDDKLRFVARSFGVLPFFTRAEELSGELLATRLVQASETPLDDALRGQLKNRAHRALERFLKSVQDEGARK